MEPTTISGQDLRKAELLAGMPKRMTAEQKQNYDDAIFAFRKIHKMEPNASQIAKYWKDQKTGKKPQGAKVLQTTTSQQKDISRALTETHAKRGEEALKQRRAAEENTRLTRDGASKKKRKRGSSEASSNGSKDRHDQSGQAPRQKNKGILAQSKRKLPPADTTSNSTVHVPSTPQETKRQRPNSETVLNDRTQNIKQLPVAIKQEQDIPASIIARGSKEERRAERKNPGTRTLARLKKGFAKNPP